MTHRGVWAAQRRPRILELLQARVLEILETQLADTVKSRRILPDGRSERILPLEKVALRSQERLYELRIKFSARGRPA